MTATPRTSVRRLLGLAAACTGLLALPLPATAAQPQCGQVLTESVRLEADLTGCTGAGLVIGRHGITVDLNGHTLAGSGSAGVDNPRGYDRIRIRNGRIDAFEVGIALAGASKSQVHGLELRPDAIGITVRGGIANRIAHNTIAQVFEGIRLTETRHNRVASNVVTGAAFGALVLSRSHRNVIAANRLDGDIGASLRDSHRNVLIRNSGAGIALAGSDRAQLIANGVEDARANGIFVDAGSDHALLVRNTVTASGLNGIDVQSPTATLARNAGTANGGYGIRAVPGVTDGGGNRASGNSAPQQCAGVSCG